MKTETTYVERLKNRQKLLNGDKMYNANIKNRFELLADHGFKRAKNSTAMNKKLLGIDPPLGVLPRSHKNVI